MSDNEANGQPLHNQLPPADADEEEQPVDQQEIDDGYEADDEGPEGWPQDPFLDDDNMSVVTEEGENANEGQVEPDQANNPDNISDNNN